MFVVFVCGSLVVGMRCVVFGFGSLVDGIGCIVFVVGRVVHIEFVVHIGWKLMFVYNVGWEEFVFGGLLIMVVVESTSVMWNSTGGGQ